MSSPFTLWILEIAIFFSQFHKDDDNNSSNNNDDDDDDDDNNNNEILNYFLQKSNV